jgi:hypothetical protein
MNGSTNESTDGRYQARHATAHDACAVPKPQIGYSASAFG